MNDTRPTKTRSKIGFTYSDLESSIDLISVVEGRGAGSCNVDQLAAWKEMSSTSGTFRTRLSSARMFGLIDVEKKEVTLTDLGYATLTEHSGAHVEAFLNIPLFVAMYDRLKGRRLPANSALDNLVVSFGVPVKQKQVARRSFLNSATQAGFIDAETQILIEPKVEDAVDVQTEEVISATSPMPEHGDLLSRLDPTIVGLLEHIPEGKIWGKKARTDWLEVLGRFLALIYQEGETQFNPNDVHAEKEDY